VNRTAVEFSDVLKEIDNLNPQNEKGLALIQPLYENRAELLRCRQETNLASQRIVRPQHWSILILLAVVMVGMVLAMRDGTVIFSVIACFLSLAIYYIFLLIYKIDTNIFLEEQLAFQNSQVVFVELGTLKYFPQEIADDVRIRNLNEDYRIGVYKDASKQSEREVKVINVRK